MTIDREKLKRMHDVMQQNGYTQDYATFEKKFVGNDNYANRKKVYDLFSQNGADVGKSYDEFIARLQAKPTVALKKPAATQPNPANTPRKHMTVMEMQRQVSQELANGTLSKPQQTAKPKQQPQGTPAYLQQWNLLHKRDDQMTPSERAQASNIRGRMQNAARQAYQQGQKQKKANPIASSRISTQQPMKAVSPQPYTDASLDMDETTHSLSTSEAKRERAIQQHKDDATNLAGFEVNDNKFTHNDGSFGSITPQIDSLIEPSMKEADDLSWKQYQEQLGKAGYDGYLRDKAWKDLQDSRIKNRQEILAKNLGAKLQEIYSQKGFQQHIIESADKLNMGIEEYVDKYVTPQIMNRAQNILNIKNIEEIMPKSSVEYVVRSLSDSILGTLSASQDKSLSERMRDQQAMAIVGGLEEMPTAKGYKGEQTYRAGLGTRFLSTAANMAMDSPILGLTGGGANLGVDLGKQILTRGLAKVGLAKAGAKLTAQQLGFKVANMTMAQKIGSGLLEGSARGALNLGGYSGITAALGQASTGDDTSLSAVAQAGWEGAKHGATTGAMFGATGAVMAPWIQKFGINGTETSRGQRWLHGAQKAGATALGLGVEAGTMMVADNVTGDKEISVGQWLEDVVMVGAFKAGEPSNYGKIGQALYGLTHKTSSTFRFGKDSDGNWRQVDIRLTDTEKNELVNSTSGKNLMDAFDKVDKSNLNSKDNIDKNITKLAYQEFMADPNVSQSTKEKVNAAMGLFNTTRKRSYRSVNDVQNKQVLEYAQDETLLTRTSYKNAEERRNILFRQKAYRDNEDLLSLVGYAKMKDSQYLDKDGRITDNAVAFLQAHGYDLSKEPTDPENARVISDMQNPYSELRYLWNENRSLTGIFASDSAKDAIEILKKDPMRRTDEEVQKLRQFKTELDTYCFPENEAHPDQAQMQGRSIAEGEGLGTDTPNPTPVITELQNLSAAEDALQELVDSNDVFKETYETLKKQGLTNPQIYDAMIQQNGLTEEQLEPFARYLNANARVQGMQQATQEAIKQRAESVAGDWGFHGTMDGQQADGSQMLYVKDNNGRTLIVGSGDVAYDPTTGRPKEGVGDMLVCLDVQTREPVYVKVEDTTLDQTQSVEDFKNEERQRLQMINSAPYNQAAQEQAMKDVSKPQPKEEAEKGSQTEQAQLSNTEQIPVQHYTLGEKKTAKGDTFYQDESGNINMAEIPDEVFDSIGYTKAPFRLTESMVKHILDRHRNELGISTPDEAIHFVRDVMKNFDHVRLGNDGALVFSIENGRKRTGKRAITIFISEDGGDFYGLKTSGFENMKGLERRPLLWERGVKNDSSSTDTATANVATNESQLSGEHSGNASNQSIGLDGKDTNNSSNGNENNTSLTFEDGSPVPMVKDSKGRLTPDYGNMKPEQAAEVLTKQFGESAEKVVDGQIKKAEKTVKDAEKMKVDYEGEPNDILEQEELKRKTVSEAQKQLEHAQAIKKAMTAKKVAETVSKEEKPTEGANQAGSVAAQKFQGAPRLVGNKRSRTLPNNEKIKGHYEIVPAESLTPSHDATNGYKKSEGFPVDAEGRTTNDRDYENDKAAQQSTDQIALKYNGQAIEQVPVVSDEGIVYDGNGRTMAGQKAAKEGTDGEYISELLDNAENFGFTREQIEKSGIEHPRLVLVSDERMPYTTETFAKFNRSEKKAQNNTEQAVAKSKTLSPKDVGAIVSEIEGNGSLEAFFNNPNAISSLWKTLQEKGIIGQNEVAGLQDMPGVPNAQGKEFVKNLVLGAMFKPETIRMMGIDGTIKNKVINGIRAIMDNSKLGDYSLSDEIDGAIRLLYEARTNKMSVDDLLRSSDFMQGNARDRYSQISQALAQALEGKTTIFRELMSEYNDVAKNHDTGEGVLSFAEALGKDELVKEFLKTSAIIKQNKIKLYGEEGRNSEQKDGNVPTGNEERPEEAGGGTSEEKPAESQQRVDNAVKKLATEITKQTGITIHTNEKESQKALEDAEATDSNIKYHKETDKEVLDELNSGKTVKVYRAMQVIDGKLYPPMAASVGGKLVEANELGTWIRADENPDLAIPDIDPKTGKQKVDPKTGELKWKFKLDKGGKDATGKKATPINAAYNPYWHMSRSPLNDQFKSAWIRPNVVVVECEVPESELTSGYKAERAKDAVGEVDWKSGSVSGEVFKQTGRARKVILSRWCKPVRVLDDAEVAQRAKEFVGDAKVEIPENVLTPKQRIAFEEAGFKIGAPEKGVKKSEQIADALKAGLQVDNTVREHRDSRWAGGEVLGMDKLPDNVRMNPNELYSEISQYHGDYITRKLDKVSEDGTVNFFSAHDGKWYFYSIDKDHSINIFDAITANRENYEEFKNKLKEYGFDGSSKTVREDMQEAGYTGRTNSDKLESFVRGGFTEGDRFRTEDSGRGQRTNGHRDSESADETGSKPMSESENGEIRQFRTKDGEVYGFVVDGEIHLDTKKMKPETPLHEYTHLWTSALQRVNAKEWANVKSLLDSVEGLKEEIQKLYPELKGDDLYDEMLATYSGREGTKKLEETAKNIAAKEGKSLTDSVKAKSFLGKVKEALKKYWNGVADMLHINFTSAEDVADKVLADWANGVNPNEIKSDEKSTNPLETLKKSAESYNEDKLNEARKAFKEAKDSGDTSEINRTRDELKSMLDAKYRSQGMGLVQRRKEIAKEIGKAEAEKVNKPWSEMEFDEQVMETEKKPLDANEIKNSDCDPIDKANATAYLNGDRNIINTLSYLTVYDNVRNRERDSVSSIGTEDGTQLDAADNAGSEGLGRAGSRPQGVDSRQLGREESNGNPESGKPLQSGERVSGGESGETHASSTDGERGGEQVHGESSRVEAVHGGGSESKGSSGVRGNGRDVRKRGNERGSSNGNGEATGSSEGRGIDSRNLSTVEAINKEIDSVQSEIDDLFNSLLDGRTKGDIKSDRANGSVIPLASDHLLGKLGMNRQKMEVYKKLIPLLTKRGYLEIKKGITKLSDWVESMKNSFGGHLTKLGLTDEEVYDYIKQMWNSNIEVDGKVRKLSEWASIMGTERMKKEIATPNAEKHKRQMEAEPIAVKIGDKKNIEETLPFLLPQQHEDVYRAETQFFGKEHTDREHAYGKGYMFTNGTGTGKTYTGLGIAKRLVKQGKGRILFVTPSQKKVTDWVNDGKNLGLNIRSLDDWAKERGTTATTESGDGCVITTFANFGLNKKLLETEWDAVIYDESHRIMENKKGAETARSMQHYMVTNRDENNCFLRLQTINPAYQKMQKAADDFAKQHEVERQKIIKEYKQSHPEATTKDVINATHKMMPRDINSFASADSQTFPKLGKAYDKFIKAKNDYYNNVEPKLKQQAKETWKNTKTVFLSATPFNTRENLDYAEGYIFKYPESDGSKIGGRSRFYLDHFGAAYKFRYNRLESHVSNPDAVAKQEIAFSDYLQNTLGTMSGRIIDSPYDYSRDFPVVSPDHADDFNNAVQECFHSKYLYEAYGKTIGDYNYGSALFETMKVANTIDRIKQHLAAGRKVVIYHRRVETKEPIRPPFAYMLDVANKMISEMRKGKERDEFIQEVKAFREKHQDLLQWEQGLDYSMPREQIAKVFGKDNVLFFSGKESKKVKDKAVDTFNQDDSGKNILVIQEASGKEGISLHDTTGKHQRVVITLALPQSPITALQIEGRIYRIGNKSNAIFEYPILGLNSEMMLFGQKFNNQVSTTENLALGSQARNLRDSFAKGILEHSGIAPIENQGVGGKAFDAPKEQGESDPFEDSVLDYYSNQKLNKNNREGVDYFPTPEPLGYKMVQWAGLGDGDSVLEPSAGHGAIARYVPKDNEMVSIEPSQSLFSKLQLRAGGLGRKFLNNIFENYDIHNKHDAVIMNPPFGTAGATAIKHVDKAFRHLDEGGRIVAIIPRGSTDKKFDAWIAQNKDAVLRAEVNLPDITFQQAGTSVASRVVVLDKITDAKNREKAGRVETTDLSGHYEKIEDFFNDLRNIEMPSRIIDTNMKMLKKSRQSVKDIRDIKGVAYADLDKENGANVRMKNDWQNFYISFQNSDKPDVWKQKMASYYKQYDELQKSTYNEDKQAVFDEMKKLACKLADMSEEEMQRFVDSKGTHFRTEENSENGESSEKLFLSLQSDKSNNKKEHYDTVTELANRVKQGTARIVREGEEAESDRSVNRRESIPAIAGRILNAANKQSDGQLGGLARGASDQQREKVLRFNTLYGQVEDWAKENGCYFTEEEIAKDSLDGKVWNDKGVESTVYRSKDGKSVIKVMSIDNYYNSPMDYYLDRNKYFNEAFPDTAIEVVGYGRDNDGRPAVIYKQPLVEGETIIEHFNGDENAANSYIDKYLSDMGYNKKVAHDKWGGVSDSNGKFNLFDVNYSNVIIDKNGNPHVIDAEVLPVDYKEGENIEIKDSDSAKFRSDKPSVSITDDAPIVVKHVDGLSKKLGSNVNMVNSPEEVTNPAVKERLDKGENVTGWYDEKTGEVHLYMPNIHDRYTAEKTIWHEVVGHKGMRGLFGDKFNNFLRSVYYDLDKPENAELKRLVDEERKYNPLNIYDSIEEGIARLAEDGKGEVGFWNTIKNKVTDLLHEIGYRIAPNTKDVKYLLWLSKNLQKNPNSPYWKLKANAVRYKLENEKLTTIKNGTYAGNDGKVKDYEDFTRKDWEEATDMTVHFRTTPSAATEIEIYNRAVGNVKAMAEEAYSDKMNSILELYKAIDPSIKRAEDVKTSENPYMMENLMSSRAQQVGNAFVRDQMDPLTKAFNNVLGSFSGKNMDDSIRNANLYLVKKSGLERNRAFFVRDNIRKLARNEDTMDDAKQLQADWDAEHKRLKSELNKKQITLKDYFGGLDDFIRKNVDSKYDPNKNDYSGFHEMQNILNNQDIDDALIQDEVMSAESSIGSDSKVDELWNTIKAATDYSLHMDYSGGFMDKEMYQRVSDEMNWYVPMRMFDQETAEDVYGYVDANGGRSGFVGPALMRAKGRESLSSLNILAQIGAMGEYAINRSARNAVKQALMRFVNNNEKAPVGERLVTEINPWFEKVTVGGVETWEERFPTIPDDATPLEISQAVENFEIAMKAKEAKGEAKRGVRRGNINYKFADKNHRPQHIVDVWVNGRKKSYIINGNPRAAQAINGMLDHKGAHNWFSKSNRWLSQVCTSYNPEFTVRNAIRDYGFATNTLLAKEGVAYTLKFEKHYAALGLLPIINTAKGTGNANLGDIKNALAVSLFKQYKNGTLDVTKSKYHKWFKEFMDNGGETGYLQMKNVDAWKKKIDTDIKDIHKGKLQKINPVKTVVGFVEDMNQMAENIARFATFCASRESGRNATRSAYDAKEVSVNFNRSGSAENVKSYKYEDMGKGAERARNAFGFSSYYLRNYTMFFNASVQSFKGLSRNMQKAPARTIAFMAAVPMSLGLLIPLVNQMLYGLLDDDEKDRKGVKDPYAELPDYIRRNNLCIYAGKGRFIQIPIAIEGRAFYGLGDIMASYTYKKDLKENRSLPLDIANQLAQIVPVGSFMESSSTSGDYKAFLSSTATTFLPSVLSPVIELVANRDWKGQPIYNDATYMENAPAWKKAYSGTSEVFTWANKKANAWTNDVDPGNENMKGSTTADALTNPFVWEQLFDSYVGGMGTFATRTFTTIGHALDKDKEVEVKDIPFVRNLLYTPSSRTSLQRTKSKWYNYKDEVETTNYNLSQLKRDSKDPLIGLKSATAWFKYINSPKSEEVNIVNDYDARIGKLNQVLKVTTDNDAIREIEAEKDKLMQEAVAKLDSLDD